MPQSSHNVPESEGGTEGGTGGGSGDHHNTTNVSKPEHLVKYGELILLGYNGSLPQGENRVISIIIYYLAFFVGDRGRRRSKFVLYRRPKPNGVSKSKHYSVATPSNSEAILDSRQHSISYTLSRNQAVIVEFNHDPNTDLFQVYMYIYIYIYYQFSNLLSSNLRIRIALTFSKQYI